MDQQEFKRQLSTLVPQLANAIIELESDLSAVECEIEICKAKIASCEGLLRFDKVIRDFIAENAPKLGECCSLLSTAIRDLDAVRTQFTRFESELFTFKQHKFTAIGQMVDDRVAASQSSVAQLPSLLADVRQRLKTHHAEAVELSTRRTTIDQSIPKLKAELTERRQVHDQLNEKHRQVGAVLEERQRAGAHEHAEWEHKEQAYEKEHQKQLVSGHLLKKQNGQLIEIRCAIRQSILEYVNKTKRLTALTTEKDEKIGQFKEVLQKYSREGVARLSKLQVDLKAKLAELDRLDDAKIDPEATSESNPSSNPSTSRESRSASKEAASKETKERAPKTTSKKRGSSNGLQAEENVKFIKQLKGKNKPTLGHLIDRLGYLDSLYDKLINTYETGQEESEVATETDEKVPDAGEAGEKEPDTSETKTDEKVLDESETKTDEKVPDKSETNADEKMPDESETKTDEKVPDASETKSNEKASDVSEMTSVKEPDANERMSNEKAPDASKTKGRAKASDANEAKTSEKAPEVNETNTNVIVASPPKADQKAKKCNEPDAGVKSKLRRSRRR